LPGLIQRLELVEEDQFDGEPPVGGTNIAASVLTQTSDQVVRAAVVVATIGTAKDVGISTLHE